MVLEGGSFVIRDYGQTLSGTLGANSNQGSLMRTNNLSLLLIACMVFITAGCGDGGGDKASTTDSAPAAEAPAAPVAPLGTASIIGSVALTGDAPDRRRVRQDPECSGLNEVPVQTEAVIVNENGTLRNVFVYVKEGLDGHTFPQATTPVLFDQRGCMYAPHVIGVQTGQDIKILNSDPLLHNIHALPNENRGFNFGMPKQGDERNRAFAVPEVMVRVKCDVHPWMGAWVGVLEHSYYSVTSDDGSFEITGLPAGDYVVEAWHEEYGTQTINVTVGDGEAGSGSFSYAAAG